MNTIEKLRSYLNTRAHESPDKYYYVTLWEDMIKLCCADMNNVISFTENECTDEEFYFFSEVFDDILEQTKNTDFLKTIRKRVLLVENAQWKSEIQKDINFVSLYVE